MDLKSKIYFILILVACFAASSSAQTPDAVLASSYYGCIAENDALVEELWDKYKKRMQRKIKLETTKNSEPDPGLLHKYLINHLKLNVSYGNQYTLSRIDNNNFKFTEDDDEITWSIDYTIPIGTIIKSNNKAKTDAIEKLHELSIEENRAIFMDLIYDLRIAKENFNQLNIIATKEEANPEDKSKANIAQLEARKIANQISVLTGDLFSIDCIE